MALKLHNKLLLFRTQKSNPGSVVSINENPLDENKLLISFLSGIVVLWDLKGQCVEERFKHESVSCIWVSLININYNFLFRLILFKASFIACLHVQNKSGYFGGPAFIQPIKAF